MKSIDSPSFGFPAARNWIMLLTLGVFVLTLAGCVSKTKVYNIQKTVVYNGAMYNVGNIKVFKPSTVAVISPTETIPLDNMDKKSFNSLLDQHNPVMVRQVITMDDQEMVYQSKNIDSWSDFKKMNDQFESAQKKISKFLANKKSTQLKLK